MAGKRNKIKRGFGEKSFRRVNTVFLFCLCLITIYPLYYIIVYSFNEGVDSLKGGLYFWPRIFTAFNYEYVLGNGSLQKAYLITIGRTVLGTLLGLIVTGITAYGFSFKDLPYRKKLMLVVLIPMLFNGGLIPYYIQLSNLKLVDTFWVYVIPGMFNIWNMFVMMKFFSEIPISLREAAVMDGAGEVRILLKVILPLSKPVLAAIGLFVAVYHWNDWYSGAFYVSSSKLLPVQTYLQRLFEADNLGLITTNSTIVAEAAARESQTSQMTVTSVKMAAVVIGTLPILCVYPFVQKHFVKGMLIGSVKE
ncbi:ABC transporter permease subunit [Anaerocolumna sedimenticola]|uniref:ABC transporter permease subunit n=1 Tax=Anaerocolumna sedimenticola TaxID=2696063 RepID=A0A6P1TTZ4_9FIRM|nr:carbohydrate ABC transporter permease [Anaerocolumna sedimenticola]QHQ63867.1 ABC transporter permease subunit [Anaerocolumna sedimenticola]